MELPKIKLSKEEIDILKQQQFFRTKRNITQKLFLEMNEVKEEIIQTVSMQQLQFPSGTDYMSGKISQGENYLGFPYIMFDFPRLFEKESITAFRTMVWWGNFAGCHWLLSGRPLNFALEKLMQHLNFFKKNEVFICVNASPWHHHFNSDNYVKLSDYSKQELLKMATEHPFLKLGRKLSLQKINHLVPFATESFKIFSTLLEKKAAAKQ